MAEGSTIRRARRLLFFGAFAPPVLFDIHHVWWEVTDDELTSGDLVLIGGCTLLLWIMASAPFRRTRKTPDSWTDVSFIGFISVLFMFTQIDTDSRADAEAFSAAAVLFAAALLYFVVPFRARRMVLTDLSPEVVNSNLTVRFRPRRGSLLKLAVEPTGIAVVKDTNPRDKIRIAARYTDITAVTSWTEVEDTEWVLPDEEERVVRLPAGELLVITVPEARLAVAIENTAKAKRLIEARRALARRQATDG